MIWVSNIVNDINSILFPPVCFGCNAQLSGGEELICTVCRHNLPLTEYNYTDENAMDRIFYGRVPIEKAASLLYFSKQGIVKNALHFLKYKRQQQIGRFFGEWFGAEIMREGMLSVDYVIPVPLHPRKLRKRGYNQVELFGQELAKHLAAIYCDSVLIKTQNTRTQTQKTRFARWKNSQGLFVVKDGGFLENKTLLLVDDVITTGATIEACAKALRTLANVKIYVATIAMAR